MDMSDDDNTNIKNITDLIALTYNYYNNNNGKVKYSDCILNLLKKNHYYPLLKVKKFKNNDNLVLIHNTYKRNNTEKFQELYDQCRSVVLDFSKSIGDNVVVSYANSIPERLLIKDYISGIDINDKCRISLDGTMITVYNYNGVWYFGTTSCPDVNSSKFSHPTKKHGDMFNEVLYELFKNNVNVEDPNVITNLRFVFTSLLNPLYSYIFILVHHENKHIIDYTNELGENYKCLFHINTKNRITLIDENIDEQPYKNFGIKYLYNFENPNDAVIYLQNNINCYGIIASRNNKLYKISSDAILHREEFNPCNPNIWYNFMYIYMLNNPNYNINNYITNYGKDYTPLFNTDGTILDPTYIIHTSFNIIKDVLYNLYISSTKYYPKYKRFKTNLDLDKTFNPTIRFHLAQLRHQQTTIYVKRLLNSNNILNYLCQSNNIKNIKILINYFVNNRIFDIPDKNLFCLNILNNLLINI